VNAGVHPTYTTTFTVLPPATVMTQPPPTL
jgi:hypothetical protein